MSVSRYERSESVSFVLNSKVYVVEEKYVKNLAAFNPLFDKSGRLEPEGLFIFQIGGVGEIKLPK